MVKDWPEFMKWFKDHNIHTIARIVTFKDNLLSAAHPEWAVRDSATGRPWKDAEGSVGVIPTVLKCRTTTSPSPSKRPSSASTRCSSTMYASLLDGAVGRAAFSGPNTAANRVSTIAGVLGRAKQALAPYNA